MSVHNFLIEKADAGIRLDLFLTSKLGKSRSAVQDSLKAGVVQINSTIVTKASTKLREGDRIVIQETEAEEKLELAPVPGDLDILYEDEALLVLNKAQDVVIHPAAGHKGNTLVHHLLHYFAEHPSFHSISPVRPGIVHRLDKGTSGVLVIAKNRQVQDHLSAQFKARTVEKQYECLVWGTVHRSGTLKNPIGRDRTHRKKMSSKTSTPRASETTFNPLHHFTHFSHLLVQPKTGRTHQIRVHLSEFGHSIVGDPLYGKGLTSKREESLDPNITDFLKSIQLPFLHARSLSFAHPTTGERLSFTAARPDSFETFLELLKTKDSP